MSDLVWLSAAAQARAIKSREVSSVELVRAHLDRIAAVDERLGSYLVVDGERALARAAEVDAALAAGQDPGPLAGVPIAHKDVLVTEGLVTTAGSKILAGWVPPYDAAAVARLRDAGAVLLGKLNCDEFAMGSSNESSAFKPTRNPWDLDRVPGGSSGGSAAAVAAGLAAITLGTDTGGSIRQPAALCGVVGIKPTYGRVSRWGAIAYASSLDQIGPMARTVEDAALALEIIAGHDPRDATSIDAPVPRYRDALDQGVAGLTVGLPREFFDIGPDALDGEVRAAAERAIAALRDAGAKVVDVSLPHTKYALPAYYLVAPAEASSNLARYDGVRYGLRVGGGGSLLDMYRQTRGAGFGDEVKRRIMIGTYALRAGYYDAYYKKAQQVRTLIKRDFDQAFETVDLVLTPTTPTPAFKLGEKSTPIEMYLADVFTLSCNLAGLPGVAVPAGFTSSPGALDLPVGVQLLGRPLDESTLLRAAAVLEKALGISGRRPTLPGTVA